jgi:ribosomal protein L3
MAKNTRLKPNPLQEMARRTVRDFINQINGVKPERSISSPVKGTEAWYRDQLAEKLKGKVEVNTEAGRIDILTDTELIEVKRVSAWKGAIGQVKSYGCYYPNHSKRIHLFGKLTERRLKMIQEVCQLEGILVTYE